MVSVCRNCSRPLPAAVAGDPAVFCMYCGHRIDPDPADIVALTATHLPADIDAPSAGPDSADVLTRGLAADRSSAPTVVARPPVVVGGYRLVRCLGVGGMGAVYEAESDDGSARVAVKLLTGRLAENPHSVERFKIEGRIASQIAHPRCVFVLGADTDSGRPYIVMELMPGTTLKDLVDKRGPLPPAEAVAHVMDVAEGLAEAHRLGVIHRDVKPSNCFLTADGRVKVGDFGLSKSLAAEAAAGQLTQTGAFLGTVLFASPEQIRGEAVGYESDVYSACATLYYLLTGRAPHQHTSLTGALAKAISEPPVPARTVRPGVPKSLDRLILRGLDRTPVRRWASAADLRDALRDQMPAAHTPARLRTTALAYVADLLTLLFVAAVLFDLMSDADATDWPFAAGWVCTAVAVAYFGTAEGWFGTTMGKQLLRLRLARVGETGPPGLGRGLLRAAFFHLTCFFALTGLGAIFDSTVLVGDQILGGVVAAVGLVSLTVQLKRTPAGFRGIHDRLTGCHTLQRPRPPERVRLVSRFPNPLDQPRPSADLPAGVGGYTVAGVVAELPGGGAVWAGEDRALGRRVLIRVGPVGRRVSAPDRAAVRPARLRVVGQGELRWGGGVRGWVAYVAPSGAPLADVIDPARPLDWADAQLLIEQLVDELIASEEDETGVSQPTVGQVWVEPGGRLRLIDVPLPTGRATAGVESASLPQPIRFVRAVASLALEGTPRVAAGQVRAPVPPHAAAVTDRLFADPPDGYATLAELRADLAETHSHPPRVTASMRAAHLWVQAAVMSAGLVGMFAAAGLYSLGLAVAADGDRRAWDAVREAASDPTRRADVLAEVGKLPPDDQFRGRVVTALAPAEVNTTLALLDSQRDSLQANVRRNRGRLTVPERALFARVSPVYNGEAADWTPADLAAGIDEFVGLARRGEAPYPVRRWEWFWTAAGVVVAVPAVWAAFAFAFHGGLAMTLAGITLVRLDGRPAARLRCAARELLVWVPVVGLLLTGLWLQAAFTGVTLRVLVWLSAVALLPVYVVLALRTPARPPQDRVMGTMLVPV